MHLSVFDLALNREKGYLLPMEKNLPKFHLEDSVETSACKLFSELKLVTDNLSLYAAAN